MRISDWSSDVCSSDLQGARAAPAALVRYQRLRLDARQRLVVKARRRQRQFQQLEGPRTVVSQGGQVDGDVIAVSVEADRDRLVAHGILEIVGFQVAGALGEQRHGKTGQSLNTKERRVGQEVVRTCRSR